MLARADAVATLTAEPFDVLVIGGGITGAGVALDAATRGYSVALIERADFASGTSSRSSKLVHGGLRYLQNFDLGLVREALLERQINVNLAPHLVRPLRFVVPAFDGARLDRIIGLALNAYDVMAVDRLRRRRVRQEADWSPARHRVISGAEVVELLPALAGRAPTGGYLFYDCQTDDARLVLTVLAEAERFGAVVANRLEAVELLQDAGKACGARVRDKESGDELEIRAANVVNATGVWADRLRPSELHDEAEVPIIRPSRGTHLVVDGAAFPMSAGAVVPAGEGRTIFVLPWLGQTLIGTTDTDHDGDTDHVRPSDAEISYLLDAVNAFFSTSLGPGDLAGAYAGVRPLISSGDRGKSVDISRKAELYETSSGMITITGGKLTTWRRMAKQTVDRIVERDGSDARCVTHEIPLGMAVAPEDLIDGPRRRARAARRPLRPPGPRRARADREPAGAGGADRARPPRPAGRGRLRRPARAGAHRRRRAVAPDAPRAHRRPAVARARCGRDRARRGRDGGGAGLGRGTPRARGRSLPRRSGK